MVTLPQFIPVKSSISSIPLYHPSPRPPTIVCSHDVAVSSQFMLSQFLSHGGTELLPHICGPAADSKYIARVHIHNSYL